MDTVLYIDGQWRSSRSGRTLPVLNPATDEICGSVAYADIEDLDEALQAADGGFKIWRETPAFDRSSVMLKAAGLLRERAEDISRLITLEQGKPLVEARMELVRAAEVIEWLAAEATRAYGRLIPSRARGQEHRVIKEPIGPVAAFTPWNFPINQMVRKVAGALAAGCSIIAKGPEETPASCAELVRAFADAGVARGAINLVFGLPAQISEHLIASPVIRKVSFTGSVAVGKHLASLAGRHMKPVTMELGGHSPVLVFADAVLESTVPMLTAAKWRNAGQTCISPTRFLVERAAYEKTLEMFVDSANNVSVGGGFSDETAMGPMANERRIAAMEALIADAVQQGGQVAAGGRRIGNKGNYFEPTVLVDVPKTARVMNEEPFGPVALLLPFDTVEEAVAEANRLSFGLASYAFTSSAPLAARLVSELECGMLGLNNLALGTPETPFGGVKESGYGVEGGLEAVQAFQITRYVATAGFCA